MGLDFQEVLLEIEERLSVSLERYEVQDIIQDRDIRAGDLYDLVLQKLSLFDSARNSVSLNAALWRQMESLLASVTGHSVGDINLSTPLEAIMKRKERRGLWSQMQALSPFRIREFDYSRLLRISAVAMTVVVAFVELKGLWQFPALFGFWPLLGLLSVWMVIETHLKSLEILKPWRNELSRGMQTVKDLCRDTLAMNYEQICEEADLSKINPTDTRCLNIWQTLQDTLVDVLGVDSDEINFNTRLIQDLGMQ